MKRGLLALILLAGATSGRAGDGRAGGVAAVTSAAPGDRIVLATGPLAGTLEPCRCTEGMLGGVPRRASLVARFSQDRPVLLADLGDLAKPSEAQDSLVEHRVRGALEALAAIGPVASVTRHAIGLGCTDARLGLARLERLTRAAGAIDWVATNVRGGPAFLKASVTDGDLQVLAVLDPEVGAPPEGCSLDDPRAAVEANLARGKRTIVLWHGEPESAERALGTLEGVAAVICGHGEVGRPARRLASGATLLTLEAKGAKLHALAVGGVVREASHPLDALVPDAQGARAALDRYYEAASRIAPSVLEQKIPGEGGRFEGSASCADCHPEAMKVWKKTGHSKALERLRAKDPKRAGLAECVVCHVTGYGLESGWTHETRGDLASVGCESCHGVGSEHVRLATEKGEDAVKGFGILKGEWPRAWRDRCIRCHDPENSPGFRLEDYLKKIRHWKRS